MGQHLKQTVKIEEVFPLLGLHLKQYGEQWRGACPVCKTGDDRALVVTPAKCAYYCFSAKHGGDVIALVSHIKDLGMKEAAQLIAEASRLKSEPTASAREHTLPSTVPEREKAGFNHFGFLSNEDQTALIRLGTAGSSITRSTGG